MTDFKRIPLVHQPSTVVDADDYPRVVAAGPWRFAICDNKLYAHRLVDGRIERLHTFLTGWPLVDHINGDGLDNRRANLRPATPGQNAANASRPRHNTSGYKGVSLYIRTGRWRAYITVDGTVHHLGYFDTAEQAARAYDAAAAQAFGAYARLNFPLEEPA